ncbi:hypothetical protein PN478_05125 [Dolichospermum circinale CS-534/05]|uniref:hypothetical protein n=1 Tax=Dolichospermum circinale TaxID=109265 RepID=UPI00232E431D|nr:hypothetical protein [Dolichospermum circinale]MDB9489900.1 hypothetical protein [Dolichospermum circinale CS-534/05]
MKLKVSGRDLVLTNNLKTATGKYFQELFTASVHLIGGSLEREVRANDKLTLKSLARLSLEYNLSFRHCVLILEARRILPKNTLRSLTNKGVKVNDLMNKVRNELLDQKSNLHQ